MRVVVLVKANEESEAGIMPSEELLTAMGKSNEELVKAGASEIEIRPIFEAEDFGEAFTPQLREQEERLVAKMAENAKK